MLSGLKKKSNILLNNYKRLMGHQVRLGQVRSECLTCTFRASCCSARLSWTQVSGFAGSSPRDRNKKKKEAEGVRGGGTACTGGYNGVRAVRSESVAGGGWFEVLWNLECPVGFSQKINTCTFQWRKFWSNLDGPPKNKELWSYVLSFEFSRPNSNSDRT